MNLGLSFGTYLEQTQTLRLSHEQRMLITGLVFTLRMNLIESVRGEKLEPRATCPKCQRVLTAGEILVGFNRNPHDFTTHCPEKTCLFRFPPTVQHRYMSGTVQEVAFMCGPQTLGQLRQRGLAELTPEQLMKENAAVYHSALAHFGTLKEAFRRIGVAYGFEAVVKTKDWKQKIHPYLGNLPDTMIAECVGIPLYAVRTTRRTLRIPPFRKHELANGMG